MQIVIGIAGGRGMVRRKVRSFVVCAYCPMFSSPSISFQSLSFSYLCDSAGHNPPCLYLPPRRDHGPCWRSWKRFVRRFDESSMFRVLPYPEIKIEDQPTTQLGVSVLSYLVCKTGAGSVDSLRRSDCGASCLFLMKMLSLAVAHFVS